MDTEEFLGIDSSRLNADLLVEKFEEDAQVFTEILDIMYRDTYPLSMRAGRVIWLIGKKYPDYVKPYLHEMIERLPAFKIEGVKRNILSLLVDTGLPDIDMGGLFDYCYTALESEKEPVAIRAHSIYILYEISRMEHELKPELINFLESLIPCESTGIETRIKQILQKLYKETGQVK
jgi:hypothetical protein